MIDPSKPLNWREFVDTSNFYHRRGKSLRTSHIQTVPVLPPIVPRKDVTEPVLLPGTLRILAREERRLEAVGESLQIEGEE